MTPDVAVVAIGRNEGARLRACLASLQGQVAQIVYVDSGSTDDSVAAARAAGAKVVALDMSVPFTAARARNAGFAALEGPAFVQFVDGDCALDPDWLPAGRAHLEAHPTLGLVTGWRSEIAPQASTYNAMCHHEWHRPAGPIRNCGGDMLVRAQAFTQAGAFNEQVIAAEDDEFCLRLADAGWGLERLPREMTRHDAAMSTFGQWWKRAVRAGHGFAQVGALHPGYFSTERKRTVLYALVVPLLMILGGLLAWWLPLLFALAYPFNYWRTARGLRAEGLPADQVRRFAGLLVLAKFPNLLGMTRYYLRRLRGARMRIIEYK